jgi:hypothetical protein
LLFAIKKSSDQHHQNCAAVPAARRHCRGQLPL